MRWRLRLRISLGWRSWRAASRERWDGISYLTADPFLRVESVGDRISLQWQDRSPSCEVRYGQPFAVLRALLAEYAMPPAQEGPPFQSGAVGAFAYDLGRQLEELPSRARNDVPTAELSLGFYDWVLAHDHQNGNFLAGDHRPA